MKKEMYAYIITTEEIKEYVKNNNDNMATALSRRYWHNGKCKLKEGNNEYYLWSYDIELFSGRIETTWKLKRITGRQ